MANKGRNVSVGDAVPDGRVDEVGKESDAHFEVVGCDVHDTGGKLKDGDLGGDLKFADSIEETVGGNAGIGVDYRMLDMIMTVTVKLTDEDIVADPNIAISPSGAVGRVNSFTQSPCGSLSFIGRSPVVCSLKIDKFVFHGAGDPESEVHVRCFLKLPLPLEPAWLFAVRWSSDPSNTIVSIKRHAFFTFCFSHELEAIIVDKYVS